MKVVHAVIFLSLLILVGFTHANPKQKEVTINYKGEVFSGLLSVEIDLKQAISREELAYAHLDEVEIIAKSEGGYFSNKALCALKLDGSRVPKDSVKISKRRREVLTLRNTDPKNIVNHGAWKLVFTLAPVRLWTVTVRYRLQQQNPPRPRPRGLLFGGMFGLGYKMQNGRRVNDHHVNPLTNNFNCPAGYTASRFRNAPTHDNNAVYCWKKKSFHHERPLAYFGGMFAKSFINPITGARTCPSGFTAKLVSGAVYKDSAAYAWRIQDESISYCIKFPRNNELFRNNIVFGGMLGVDVNPITNDHTCPTARGFNQAQISKDGQFVDSPSNRMIDYYAAFCWKWRRSN